MLKQLIQSLFDALWGKESHGALNTQMVRGASGTLILKMIAVGLAFATAIILARILGARGYGTYTYTLSWVLVLSVPAVVGLPTLLTREAARYRTKSDWGSLRGLLRWSNRIVLVVSLVLLTIVALLLHFFQGQFETSVRISLWIAFPLIPLFAFISIIEGSVRGLGHVVKAQLPSVLVFPVLFIALVWIAHIAFNLTPPLVMGINVFAVGIALVVGTILLKRCIPIPARGASPDYDARGWLRSARPLLFVGIAGVINRKISLLMLGSMLGLETVGIYNVAVGGATLITFILVVVNMPLAPIVAELYTSGNRVRLQRVVTMSARVVLLGSLPIAIGLIFFGDWFLLIFGKEFAVGFSALIILSVGEMVNASMGSVALLLNMTGNERDVAKGIGIAAALNIVLNAILIPIWGLIGAAVATTISMAIWNIFMAVLVYKKLGICSIALIPVRVGKSPS